MRTTTRLSLFTALAALSANAAAQWYYFPPPPPLPQLSCAAVPRTIPNGQGSGGGGVQTLSLSVPSVNGAATWTYSPPADGINLATYAYSIADLRYGVPSSIQLYTGYGVISSATTHVRILVRSDDGITTVYSDLQALDPALTISSSRYNFTTTNPIVASLSSSVETLVARNANWSIVIQAVRDTGLGGDISATNPNWTRNIAACRMVIRDPLSSAPRK